MEGESPGDGVNVVKNCFQHLIFGIVQRPVMGRSKIAKITNLFFLNLYLICIQSSVIV